MGSTIVEIEVGSGPCGELRYPAYQLDRWDFCGIGSFQSYSSYAATSLTAAATAAGHSEWAVSPANAGSYNSKPYDTEFFASSSSEDNYRSDYGKFFLDWYAQALVDHGDAVLAAARSSFDSSIKLSVKVAGIHWWYLDASHAAEITSGYYNDVDGGNDVYGDIAKMVSLHNATFDFTCLEMSDSEQPSECSCGPYELVQQTKASASTYRAGYAGENALQRYDQSAYDTIKTQAQGANAFTYLRLTDDLMSGSNWDTFVQFVNDMKYV
jgi:beta-amylase